MLGLISRSCELCNIFFCVAFCQSLSGTMMRGIRTPCFDSLFVMARVGSDSVVLTEVAVVQVCFSNLGTPCWCYPLPWSTCRDPPRTYFFISFVKMQLPGGSEEHRAERDCLVSSASLSSSCELRHVTKPLSASVSSGLKWR